MSPPPPMPPAVAAPPPRWPAVARFFAPLVTMLALYAAQGLWVDALRGRVRVAEPLAWELSWFGVRLGDSVVTPAAWWQAHPHPVLDVVCGAAYLLFLPAFVGAAAWWRFGRKEPRADRAMGALLALSVAGYATYLLYPAAPPWYAERYGLRPVLLSAPAEAAGAARFDAALGVTWCADYYRRSTNIFGAMPSLHVGIAFLAVFYAWRLGSLRAAALAFWALIFFASVYLNHHYLIDGFAGMALALAAAGTVEKIAATRR